jgi:hypothetical protein
MVHLRTPSTSGSRTEGVPVALRWTAIAGGAVTPLGTLRRTRCGASRTTSGTHIGALKTPTPGRSNASSRTSKVVHGCALSPRHPLGHQGLLLMRQLIGHRLLPHQVRIFLPKHDQDVRSRRQHGQRANNQQRVAGSPPATGTARLMSVVYPTRFAFLVGYLGLLLQIAMYRNESYTYITWSMVSYVCAYTSDVRIHVRL